MLLAVKYPVWIRFQISPESKWLFSIRGLRFILCRVGSKRNAMRELHIEYQKNQLVWLTALFVLWSHQAIFASAFKSPWEHWRSSESVARRLACFIGYGRNVADKTVPQARGQGMQVSYDCGSGTGGYVSCGMQSRHASWIMKRGLKAHAKKCKARRRQRSNYVSMWSVCSAIEAQLLPDRQTESRQIDRPRDSKKRE